CLRLFAFRYTCFPSISCLSLHDALPISILLALSLGAHAQSGNSSSIAGTVVDPSGAVVTNATVEVRNPVSGFSLLPRMDQLRCRSEEHTSELQSRGHLVCRLLLEKKNTS